jgi:hypothetical protein
VDGLKRSVAYFRIYGTIIESDNVAAVILLHILSYSTKSPISCIIKYITEDDRFSLRTTQLVTSISNFSATH